MYVIRHQNGGYLRMASNNGSSSSGKMGGGTIGTLIGILVVFEIIKSGIFSGPFVGFLGLACMAKFDAFHHLF